MTSRNNAARQLPFAILSFTGMNQPETSYADWQAQLATFTRSALAARSKRCSQN
jgi:hypothetical protein